MKTSLTISALAVAATLIVCGGCIDPETTAKHSTDETPEVDRETAPRDIAEATNVRSPSGDRDGRENSDPEESQTAAGNLADRGSSPGTDAASSDSDSNSKKTASAGKRPPKKEFKFEFVSSSGNEGLEPGDTIPEISGRDLDNIKFNLSDYEGKVVMLDFWGDW